jgi:predicted ATPase/transcriptional regulator with XRE-family HTH domain
MDLETSFGHWLRQRRRALDLTQADLARRVGCAIITIQKLEADERRPSRLLAERLADSLMVAAEERAALITLARAEPYRDVAPAVPVHQLLAPQRLPSKLPTPLTRLIGRDQDLAAVRNVLLRGEVRLLTLLGPPGIGKTSLSLAAARDIQAAFSDGAFFVALAPITDPALVLATLAQTLGIKESADQSLLDTLKAALQAQRLLLLLDNFEHLLAAAPLIVELLERCVGLKALVTSRAALHVRGEQLYAVPPLLLPDLSQLPATGALARTPAVALFVERAQAALPHFTLTAQNAAAVAAICVRLDGLPLAIELAAARVRLLAPEGLLARLEQRLAVLTDGARDLPPRQQTLRAAIAWSYELLDKGEQMLFRRLSVFVGGWTLHAAEAVCNADGDLPWEVVNGLAALLDQSLVRQSEGANGEPRFTMLETIREYALERLAARGEVDALRAQHLEHYLALAEAAEPYLRGAEQIVWAERLEVEHDNFRAALAWSHVHRAVDGSSTDGAEAELRLAGALFWFWDLRTHFSEGRRWLEGALAPTNGPARTTARATALFGTGHFAANQSDYVAARARLEESVALWRALGDKRGLALALTYVNGLGWVTLQEGRVAAARALFAEGVALWRALGDRWGLAWALWSLSAAVRRDDPAAARPIAEESVALFREVGDRLGLAFPLMQLGIVARLEGDHTRSTALVEESLALGRELGAKGIMSVALRHLGDVMQDQGDEQRALALYQESVALARPLENKQNIAFCLVGIGGVAGAVGQGERAARLLSAAETLFDTIGLSLALGPEVRADYDRYVSAAHAQLDAATWAAAWAEGRTMTLEQAIAYALNATSPAPTPSHLPPHPIVPQ